MTEQPINTRSLLVLPKPVLEFSGIAGFSVEDVESSHFHPTDQISSYVYNPSRNSVTFCLENPVAYCTYDLSQVRIEMVVEDDSDHNVQAAQGFLWGGA